jgi:hypothetical protein
VLTKLALLPLPDAVRLLGSLIGERRVREDGHATAQVARYCDRLPLALVTQP